MPTSRAPDSQSKSNQLFPRFGLGFLEDHARRIITDPRIALVELVANCWDAGGDTVRITWPNPAPDTMAIEDNGTGMSYNEFTSRWLELNYNRGQAQGLDVLFPEGNISSHRRAFGINGKGRHSMFCFADKYLVETWKDGEANSFLVKRSTAISSTPFTINHHSRDIKQGHGTRVSTSTANSSN
jgi:HSP90 family molecular chaperone